MTTKSPQYEDNKALAIEIAKEFDGKLPSGMYIAARDYYCEIGVNKTVYPDGNPRVACVSYDQNSDMFKAECNNACEALHRMAKRKEREIKAMVHACEANPVNGKCPCGFELKADENLVQMDIGSARVAGNASNSNRKASKLNEKSFDISKHHPNSFVARIANKEETEPIDFDCPF